VQRPFNDIHRADWYERWAGLHFHEPKWSGTTARQNSLRERKPYRFCPNIADRASRGTIQQSQPLPQDSREKPDSARHKPRLYTSEFLWCKLRMHVHRSSSPPWRESHASSQRSVECDVVPQSCWDSDEQAPHQYPKPQLDHNPWGDSDRENTQQTDP
jgi:hypothetical protein